MKKYWIAALIVIILGGGVFAYSKTKMTSSTNTSSKKMAQSGSAVPAESVKEFSTTAYYDETGVWYSLKEIRVKKGDTVRIKATNIKGMHDFVIDEYGVKQELPLNQETTIEFTADKTGEFVYYCSKPGHRTKGQWGKLIVE